MNRSEVELTLTTIIDGSTAIIKLGVVGLRGDRADQDAEEDNRLEEHVCGLLLGGVGDESKENQIFGIKCRGLILRMTLEEEQSTET